MIMMFILLLIKITNSILINHASAQKTNWAFSQKFETEIYLNWSQESEFSVLIQFCSESESEWDKIFFLWDETESDFFDEMKQNQIFFQ